jgi:membrane protein
MLSMIPGLAAIIALYGEFANPQALKALSSDLRGVLPPSVVQILTQQVGRLAGQNGSSLNATPESLAWFVLMIWSANRGIAGFVDALNVIYDRVEERAFFDGSRHRWF